MLLNAFLFSVAKQLSDLKASEDAFVESLRQEVKLRLLDMPRDMRKQPLGECNFFRMKGADGEDAAEAGSEEDGVKAGLEEVPALEKVASEVEREVSKVLTTTTKKGRPRAPRASKTPAINVQVRFPGLILDISVLVILGDVSMKFDFLRHRRRCAGRRGRGRLTRPTTSRRR